MPRQKVRGEFYTILIVATKKKKKNYKGRKKQERIGSIKEQNLYEWEGNENKKQNYENKMDKMKQSSIFSPL